MPPPSSTRIVRTATTCGIGSFVPIYPTAQSNPVSLPKPERMKMTASRMRPARAALFWMLGFTLFSFCWWVLDEIEHEHFRVAALLDAHFVVAAPDLHGVARLQRLSVHFRCAAHEMHVQAPARLRLVRHRFVCVDERGIEIGILVDAHRPVAAVARGDEAQRAALGRVVEMLLLVARLDAALAGLDPDLQEMDRVAVRGVVFAVAHAGARAHALHVARPEHRSVADRILVREAAVED